MARRASPIYARIESDLRRAIGDGSWPVGSRLPSEAALCQRYGVSRMTVRQALERMVAAGLLRKRHGVGTFVATSKIERVASRLLGFREDAVAHGVRPEVRVLARTVGPAGAEDGEALRVDPQAEILRVRRLRLADGEPIGLNDIVVAPAFTPAVTDLDFRGSFYEGVAACLGVEVARADQTVEAVQGHDGAAALLGVAADAPLLRVTRVTYLADGRLLGLTRSLYRGDRYFLSLTVLRSAPAPTG